MVTDFGDKLAKVAYPTFIHHTGIPKQIRGSQCQCEKLNGNDLYMCDRSLVSFHPVIPQLMRLDCIQQLLFGTPVCFAMVADGIARSGGLHAAFAMNFLVWVNFMGTFGLFVCCS